MEKNEQQKYNDEKLLDNNGWGVGGGSRGEKPLYGRQRYLQNICGKSRAVLILSQKINL